MLEVLLIRQQGTYIWKINQLQTKSSFILHKYEHWRKLQIVFQTWIIGLGNNPPSEVLLSLHPFTICKLVEQQKNMNSQ